MPDYQDPFSRPDGTVARPRPGAGRPGRSDAGRTRVPQPQAAPAAPLSAETRAMLGAGLNPLVQAASPLILLAGHLRSTLASMDTTELRRYVLEEIRMFEERASASGVAKE